MNTTHASPVLGSLPTLSDRLIARLIDVGLLLVIGFALSRSSTVLALLVTGFYAALSDALPSGQSIGKIARHIQVVQIPSLVHCSIKASFIRNLPFFFGVVCALIPWYGWLLLVVIVLPWIATELYLLSTSNMQIRMGDLLANTRVIRGEPREPKRG